jgi:hypothetical protein
MDLRQQIMRTEIPEFPGFLPLNWQRIYFKSTPKYNSSRTDTKQSNPAGCCFAVVTYLSRNKISVQSNKYKAKSISTIAVIYALEGE